MPTVVDIGRSTRCLVIVPLLLVCACSDRDVPVRQYQEIIVEAPPRANPVAHDEVHGSLRDIPLPLQAAPPSSVASVTWTAPEGWREEPGFGMRLATLWVEADGQQAECTIVVLSGEVGSIPANIARWMDQVRLPPLSAQAMQEFIAGLHRFHTESGLNGILVDFDSLVEAPDALSTLAGIIDRGNETVFVKLTGPKVLLADVRDAFLSLCESVQ